MAMSDNTIKVLNFLKTVGADNLTAADVADRLGLDVRQVNGIFTSGIQRKGFGVRVESDIEVDGATKTVKFLKLTEEGMSFDPFAED